MRPQPTSCLFNIWNYTLKKNNIFFAKAIAYLKQEL